MGGSPSLSPAWASVSQQEARLAFRGCKSLVHRFKSTFKNQEIPPPIEEAEAAAMPGPCSRAIAGSAFQLTHVPSGPSLTNLLEPVDAPIGLRLASAPTSVGENKLPWTGTRKAQNRARLGIGADTYPHPLGFQGRGGSHICPTLHPENPGARGIPVHFKDMTRPGL